MRFILGTYLTIATEPLMAWWQSLILSFIIASGIEAYDKYSENGNAEALDIIYTVMGGGSVIVLDLLK